MPPGNDTCVSDSATVYVKWEIHYVTYDVSRRHREYVIRSQKQESDSGKWVVHKIVRNVLCCYIPNAYDLFFHSL